VAKKALAEVPVNGGLCIVARVDLVEWDGGFVVSEVECLDPELFLMRCPDPEAAAARLARAIASKLRLAP
jgi:hypothetical protein